MALKYFFEYDNPTGDFFRCEINVPDYEDEAIEISGFCVVEKPEIKKPETVIKGGGMSLNLYASNDYNFEDLVSTEVNEIFVTLQRNGGSRIFQGYIDPDGFFEDLVTDNWVLTFDCVDGLGLLEDLAFVNNDTGAIFKGKLTDIEIIRNCLTRTGIDSDIYTAIFKRYDGLSITEDILSNLKSDVQRFYKGDGETIMSCKEVLESVLGKYFAFIWHDGENWQIRAYDERTGLGAGFPNLKLWKYEGLTGSIIDEDYSWSIFEIGSQISGVSPHWVNSNQTREIEAAKGVLKVNYKYGFTTGFVDNFDFENNGTSANGWGVIVGQEAFVNYTSPVYVEIETGNSDPGAKVLQSLIGTPVLSGNKINLELELTKYNQVGKAQPFRMYASIILGDGVSTYSLQSGGTWATGNGGYVTFEIPGGVGVYSVNQETEPLPIDGDVYISLRRPASFGAGDLANLRVNKAQISAVSGNEQGENHVTYNNNGSSRSAENITIDVGDNGSALYTGTLYKDNNDPTDFWQFLNTPNDISGTQQLLEYLSKEIASYKYRNLSIINGDVYGYVPFFSLFRLDLKEGNYFCTRYSYNTKTGVTAMKFIQRISNSTNQTYEKIIDYGNVVEPTIK